MGGVNLAGRVSRLPERLLLLELYVNGMMARGSRLLGVTGGVRQSAGFGEESLMPFLLQAPWKRAIVSIDSVESALLLTFSFWVVEKTVRDIPLAAPSPSRSGRSFMTSSRGGSRKETDRFVCS